jgi:hypothetical protein
MRTARARPKPTATFPSAAYLEQNFAIDPSRIACVGQGSAPPRSRIVLIARLTSG